jgi:hypothetical protein
VRVHIDLQSAFRSLTTKFENVMINVGGLADYVPKADAKIRRIFVKADPPWKLPLTMVIRLNCLLCVMHKYLVNNSNQPVCTSKGIVWITGRS